MPIDKERTYYLLSICNDVQQFDKDIQDLIDQGWTLYGGHRVVVTPNNNLQYTQAFRKIPSPNLTEGHKI